MERLKQMKETLMSCAQSQIGGNLERVDAKELGEVVDMIKDLNEAIYYCTIVKEMEENKEERKLSEKMGQMQPQQVHQHYYPPQGYEYPPMRDMDRDYGRMYYSGGSGGNSGGSSGSGSNGSSGGNSGGSRGYSSGGNNARGGGGRGFSEQEYFMPANEFPQYPREMRDVREGRSPMNRRSYMESKEMHKGKEVEMQELEKYIQELSTDLTEMIKEASPEEKQILQQKLTLLASKMK